MEKLLVVTDVLVCPGKGLLVSPPLADEAVTFAVGAQIELHRPRGGTLRTTVVALVKERSGTRLCLPMTTPFEVGTEVFLDEGESGIVHRSGRSGESSGTMRRVAPLLPFKRAAQR